MGFIIKGILILLAVSIVIFSLATIGKKKEHFQIFPDSIKKDYFKMARIMTILNILSVLLIFASLAIINSNFSYIVIVSSMFLSSTALYSFYEEFSDFFNTEKEKKEKKIKKSKKDKKNKKDTEE